MTTTQLNTTQYPEPTDSSLMPGRIIPDGQGGVLATWTISPSNPPFPPQPWHYYQAAHVVSNSVVASYDLPFLPFKPVLNRYPTMVLGENGTAFVTDGRDPDRGPQVVSFSLASGTPNWSYQAAAGNALTIMAVTSDGGLAINDSQAGVVNLSPGGTPVLVTGALGGIPHYSWTGNWSVQGPQGTLGLQLPLVVDAASTWATPNGSASQSGIAIPLCPCMEQSIQGNAPETLPSPQIERPQSSTSPFVLAPETSGAYVQLVGDQGINGLGCPQDPTHCHNVGTRFNLAAASEAGILAASGASSVLTIRVSSVQDFNSGLTTSGLITGGVTYFGHGAEGQLPDKSWLSLLAVGQGQGVDTNVSALNVSTLSNSELGNNAAITLKTCRAGSKSSSGGPSIAQLLANQLNRGVYAWKVGAFFSQNPNATIPNGMPPQTSPMYLLPLGGSGVAPCAFIPNQPEPQRCGGEK
jgi:hypothetical protein